MKSRLVNALDFTGLNLFWQAVDELASDNEPSGGFWNRLFQTPGYKVLTKSEFTPEFFKKKWRMSFMPSLAGEREKALTKGDTYVTHYLNVLELKRDLLKYQLHLNEDQSMVKEAKQMAMQYLPSREDEGYPPLSFVVFALDARGYTPVVVDILSAYRQSGSLKWLLAHEFHHYYRNQRMDRHLVSQELGDLWWIVDQIHCEGVGNLVDKIPRINNETPPMEAFRAKVEQAPQYLEILNEGLIKISEDPNKLIEISRSLRLALPQSGHPTGFYMAHRILTTLGKQRIIEEVNDPLAFFKSYCQADQRSLLSSKAVDTLDRLLSNAYSTV